MNSMTTLGSVQGRTHWIAVCLSFAIASATAADWPQYRGPTHNGVSTERLNKQSTGAVTNPVWLVYLTNGLTSLTVGGGRVFTQVGGDLLDESASLLARKDYCVAL